MASHSGSSAFLTIAWATLSLTGRQGRLLRKGIPRGRFLPFALGMYTLLAGLAFGITHLDAKASRGCWCLPRGDRGWEGWDDKGGKGGSSAA